MPLTGSRGRSPHDRRGEVAGRPHNATRAQNYDNLKPAVVRVLKGRDRAESERFVALRSHYGFDSFFCQPGVDGRP